MLSNWWMSLSLYIEEVTPLRFFLYCAAYALALSVLGKSIDSVLFLFSLLSVYGVVYILKVTTRVKRRTDARITLDHPDRAFPSGHAAAVAFLIPAITYTAPWGMPVATVLVTCVLASVVILSRLSLRVHTVFQVIVGALIGVAVPVILISLAYTQSLFDMV